jgi:hypothetical protein
VAATEGLERGGAVHVGDGDDGHLAVGIRLGSIEGLELGPRRLDRILIGHVGHGAASGQVGQNHLLLWAREDVGCLSHEVHPTEDNGLGIWALSRGVRKLKGVADEVRVLHNLVALVEVPEDDHSVTQRLLGNADAVVQLLIGGLLVLKWQHPLARRPGRNDVAHRRARAIAVERLRVEDPRTLGELGRADAGTVGDARDDLFDLSVN